MVCPGCSDFVSDNVNFCTKCGFNLKSFREKEAASGPAAAPPAPESAVPAGGKKVAKPVVAAEFQKPAFFTDVLTYPFRGTGPFIVLFGGIMVAVLLFIPLIFKFFISIFVMGYLTLYFFSLINSSTMGKDEPPDWPDVTSLWELVSAYLMFLILFLLSFGPVAFYMPYVAYSMAKGGGITAQNLILLVLVVLWAVAYFPMGAVVAAETRNMIALNPVTVFGCVFRAPLKYFLMCLCLGVVFFFQAVLMTVFTLTVVAVVLLPFLNVYIFIVVGRILGVFYEDLV